MWDLREVHAYFDNEGWVWNESFHHKDVLVDDNEDPKEIFWQKMPDILSSEFLKQCEVVDDGEILELQIKRTGEPVFAMMKAV